jgi:hypothetical protein
MGMIVELLAQLAPTAIIEYIPETDPMVQVLLGPQTDRREYLDVDGFRNLFAARFEIADDAGIEGSERRLFRMVRR